MATFRLDYSDYMWVTKMEEFPTRGELQKFVNARSPKFFRAFKIKGRINICLIAKQGKRDYITFSEQ